MNQKYKIYIERDYDKVEVYLMRQKSGGWSFVNFTKNHICPCVFKTIGEAFEDLVNQPDIKSFKVILPKYDN